MMTMAELKPLLLWSLGLNYALLIVWFATFCLAHQWLYRLHTRWFRLSVETFDAIHYAGMAIYKLGILLLNGVPLVALMLAGA